MLQANGQRPDPSAAEDIAAFVHQLRALKVWAGNPSLDRLRRESGVPRSTLSDALNVNRQRLPTLEVVRNFVRACGCSDAEVGTWVTAWRRLQAATLSDRDRDRDRDRSELSPLVPAPPRPRQLPLDVAAFAGRHAEQRQLDELLPEPDSRPATVAIAAIEGTAGVGKTTLAVHWAHNVADRFPDGQLYVNLRGFDPCGVVMEPSEAIRGFLDALHAPPDRIPVSLDAQIGLYRSLLADRRVLIVLDNARDAEHVRPLLPGAPGCMVVVTSRSRLSGLAATQGARILTLDTLSSQDAYALLALRLGQERLDADPKAVEEIIEHCDGLPLALAIVAARAAETPDFGLQTLACELRAARLDALTAGDPATDLRTVFSWSSRALSPEAARLFRLLELAPGPVVGEAAAGALAGRTPAETRPLLAELVRGHLLTRTEPGRYRMHDLLRSHAAELGREEGSSGHRTEALTRLLDHYLHSAHRAAMLVLNVDRDPLSPAPPSSGAGPIEFAGHAEAMRWFSSEHSALLGAIRLASKHGFDTHVWQLAWTLSSSLDVRGHWQDQAQVQRLALDAVRRQDSPVGEAHTHRGLGRAYTRLERYEDARAHLERALDLFVKLDDVAGQALAHVNLGMLYESQGLLPNALRHARQALRLDLDAGNRPGQARNLNNLGWLLARSGKPSAAVRYCRRAVRLFQELGSPVGESAAWDSLGYAHHRLGEFDAAATCFHKALELSNGLGDRFIEAETLDHLGETLIAMGRYADGREAWRRALAILERLGHPDAERVRHLLR